MVFTLRGRPAAPWREVSPCGSRGPARSWGRSSETRNGTSSAPSVASVGPEQPASGQPSRNSQLKDTISHTEERMVLEQSKTQTWCTEVVQGERQSGSRKIVRGGSAYLIRTLLSLHRTGSQVGGVLIHERYLEFALRVMHCQQASDSVESDRPLFLRTCAQILAFFGRRSVDSPNRHTGKS